MTIQIRNQRPAILYDDPYDILPNIDVTLQAAEYREKIEDHIRENYVDPMFVPINANNPVVIEDVSNGTSKQIDKDTLFGAINHTWKSPVIDVNLQDQLNEIYRQGIQYHSPNDWYFEEQLGVEALTRMKLPTPTNIGNRVIQYTANTDIIPSAKQLLANADPISATNWFANITGYVHAKPFNNYLLMTIETAQEFDGIKQLMRNYMQVWQANNTIDTDTVQLINDFYNIDITSNLSAGLLLPNNGLANHTEEDALSFSRILMYVLNVYESTNNGKLLVQPTNLQQLYAPENIVILNLENYAHATSTDIRKDWETLEKALNAKKVLNFVSNKKLMTARSVSKSLSQGNVSSSAGNQQEPLTRLKVKPFTGKPVPAKHMLNMMKKIIESQITRQVTQNTYKTHKTSYMRPNRRKPDDINLPGKTTVINYRPDIHVYLDTSGSISEDQYRDAIVNLIALTRQIDCNLYITSFSHYVSQTTLLRTKNQSIENTYRQFLAVPKVSGGTDFEHVWRKIDMLDHANKRSNRSHQINFIITDFGYSLTRGHRWDREQASVKNTFYVPISADKHTWSYILDWASDFRKQMVRAGDYGVRNRMLM